MAFQWAREADPGALLILNDHFGEGLNDKSEGIYSLVQGLLQMGVPIDGVGMQMHLWLWGPPTSQELETNMQRLADLDLDVHITEMDVRTQLSSDSEEMKLAIQADTYRKAFTCLPGNAALQGLRYLGIDRSLFLDSDPHRSSRCAIAVRRKWPT